MGRLPLTLTAGCCTRLIGGLPCLALPRRTLVSCALLEPQALTIGGTGEHARQRARTRLVSAGEDWQRAVSKCHVKVDRPRPPAFITLLRSWQ
jgi:hypothetical protein